MKELNVDPKTKTAAINVEDDHKAYVVKNGRVFAVDLPDYGTSQIISVGGKVDRIEMKTSVKV